MPENNQRTLLVLSQVYPPDPTSVGQHMHDAAAEMVKRGFRVKVLASGRGYEDSSKVYAPRETMDGVEVRRLPLSSFGKSSILIRLIGGISFTLQCILSGIFTKGMTHMLVSTSPPMCPFAAVVISLFRKVHITYWVMDLNPDQMVALGKLKESSFFVKVFDWLNRRILNRSRAVVAMDRFMADRLNRKVDITEKLVVSPPWPHEDHIEPVLHDENPFRKEHELDGKTVIMYSGNLSIASPVTTILEAARRLEEIDDLLFLFIGGGLGKKEVDELIVKENPPNIRSLPYQPIERLRYSLSAADVHLVSVGQDIVGICHPCKIYGSMAVSRPILLLGPNPCHVSDIIDGQEIGWSLEYGDVDRAEQIIRDIYACSHEQRQQMGRRAREVVDQRFTKTHLCGKFCDVVEHGPNVQ